MAQYGRPISDITTTNWTASSGSTLYGTIDEASFDDVDYNSTTPNQAGTLECGLTTGLNTPTSGSQHILRTRVQVNATNKALAGSVGLYQGATEIASWSYNQSTFGGTYNTKENALSAGQIANITNYDDLRVRITVSSATGGNYLYISE